MSRDFGKQRTSQQATDWQSKFAVCSFICKFASVMRQRSKFSEEARIRG